MIVYYGIEKKQEDGSWKLEAFDCGTPFRFRSEEEAETSAITCSPLYKKAQAIVEKLLTATKFEKETAMFSNYTYWTTKEIMLLIQESGGGDWRVKEIERHEDLHATPFGDTVKRIDGDLFEGSWDCSTSPTKKCHFNIKKDPACDGCLYCHGPEERK